MTNSNNRLKRFLAFVCFAFCHYSFYFFSVSSISVSELSWSNYSTYPFEVYSTVALTGNDNNIYVFGGIDSGKVLTESYVFKVSIGYPGEWIPIAPMPIVGYGVASCVANDGRFFFFGGARSELFQNNTIQIYDTTSDSWNITTPDMPSGISIADSYMSCAVDNSTGLMYLTGGTFNGSRFLSYNVSSNSISNISNSSLAFHLKAHGSFVANNSNLYLFGGFDLVTGSYSSLTYIYDIAYGNWSMGGNMTQAVDRFGYATDGIRFYVIGGYGFSGYFEYTQVYNISKNTWAVNNGTVFPKGIEYNAALYVNGSLYFIGGKQNNSVSSAVRFASLCGLYAFSGLCNDEDVCTFNDTCNSNGQCVGTSNFTCPSPSNSSDGCQTNVCSPTFGCYIEDGTACNSSNKCLLDSFCSNGKCSNGKLQLCPQLSNCPNSTACNPSNGECIVVNSCAVSSSLSTDTIIGIAVGVFVLLIIVTLAIVFLLRYKASKRKTHREDSGIALDSMPSLKSPAYSGIDSIRSSNYYNIPAPSASTIASTLLIKSNSDPYILEWSKLRYQKKIGEGAFGCVYLGELNDTKVAIKQLLKTDATEDDIKEFMTEAEIMKKLPSHPNVIMFRGVTLPPDPLSIVTDFCDEGSLRDYLDVNPSLPISVKTRFIKDIARGMSHLHYGVPSLEVIHRDLAARNVLLKRGVAVITDFGMSRMKSSKEDSKKTQQSVGPLKWMSPESIFDGVYSTKSDVFSFAVVVYEILTQEFPWKDVNAMQAGQLVGEGRRSPIPANCSPPSELMVLMERCWSQKPEDRPDFKKICETLNKLEYS